MNAKSVFNTTALLVSQSLVTFKRFIGSVVGLLLVPVLYKEASGGMSLSKIWKLLVAKSFYEWDDALLSDCEDKAKRPNCAGVF